MNSLFHVFNESVKTIIGILSGTSMDGVDVVLTEISGSGTDTGIRVKNFYTNQYPPELKEFVKKTASRETGTVEDICRLNFYLGHFFAGSVLGFLKENNLKPEDIDLIGSHGQTIYHIPVESDFLNFKTKSTLQIGDPSVIANLTGITTIGDFRIADVSVGGDGAPLVPFLDYIFFNSVTENRVLINIGGISNITYLKNNCRIDDVIAFDTGPGNVLIDSLMKVLFGKEFDENGKVSYSGKFNSSLFEYIVKLDTFLNISPPKSTGREHYNREFIDKILVFGKDLPNEDIIRTVTEYTCYSIHYAVRTFIKSGIDNIFLSGGGVFNDFIMNSLSRYFEGTRIQSVDYIGITPENKEAVLFAVLANETLNANKTNIKSVTNAGKNVILGKICLAG